MNKLYILIFLILISVDSISASSEEMMKRDIEQEKILNEEYESLEYDFKNPYIKLNPYGRTPLSALVRFETEKEHSIKVTVIGKTREQNMEKIYSKNKEHNIEISGLYPNFENKVVIENLETSEENILKIKTDYISKKHTPIIEVKENRENRYQLYMINAYSHIIFDNFGNIRYSLEFEDDHKRGFFRLNSGNYFMFNISSPKEHFEITPLGKIEKIYDCNEFTIHHDLIQEENKIVALANKKGSLRKLSDGSEVETVEDFIIEIDIESGKVVKEIDLKNYLDINRERVVKSKNDWFHGNSIYKDGDSYIISGRHQGIVKLNEDKIEWIIADHEGWEEKYKKFLLNAVDNRNRIMEQDIQLGEKENRNFKWPYGQHSVYKIDKNKIILYDNNDILGSEKLKELHGFPEKSNILIYKIDENKKKIKLLKKIAMPFSQVQSSVNYQNGEILVLNSNLKEKNIGLDYSNLIKLNKKGKKILEINLYDISGTSYFGFYKLSTGNL